MDFENNRIDVGMIYAIWVDWKVTQLSAHETLVR